MWGKTAKILSLYQQSDMSVRAIAREMDCSPANVSRTISRYFDWRFQRLLPLDKKQVAWLAARAKKKKCTIEDVAGSLLRAAINARMEDNASD
jgi:transposase-like protein